MMRRADLRESGPEQAADEVRQLEGDRERREGAAGREVARRDDLADEPSDPAEPRGDREDRRVARDSARRRARLGGTLGRHRGRSLGTASAALFRRYTAPRLMANIHSQKKRIL